jgi:hypothetical protein
MMESMGAGHMGCMLDPLLRRDALGHMAHSRMFHRMPANHLQGAQDLAAGNTFGPLPTARRCRRGPDRRHTMRGERRSARSVPAIGIAILRRAATPVASVSGQLRPSNIRHSRGPMRSRHNRQHYSERPAIRTSRRCSDSFELA